MASEQKLELTVKVNEDTGSLDVVAGKFKATTEAAEKATGAFAGLSSGAKAVGLALLGAFSIRSVLSFIQDSVQAAEQEDQALRRLKFSVEALGGSWDSNRQKIIDWSSQLQKSTQFSDGQALASLDRLTRVTGDLKQAQTATVVAMNMSVASGKELAEMEDLLAGLILGREKSLKRANLEFGAFLKGVTTAQGALDTLTQKFQNVATSEDSFTKKTNILKHSFEDFKENFGRLMEPTLNFWMEKINGLVGVTDKLINKIRETGVLAGTSGKSSGGASGSWEQETKTVQQESEKQARIIAQKSAQEVKSEEEAYNKRIDAVMSHNQIIRGIYTETMNFEIEVQRKVTESNLAELEKRRAAAEAVAKQIGGYFGSAFADIIVDGKNLEDAMQGVFRSIMRMAVEMITQMLIAKAIKAGLTGGAGAFFAPGIGGAMGAPGVSGGGGGMFNGKVTPSNSGGFRRTSGVPPSVRRDMSSGRSPGSWNPSSFVNFSDGVLNWSDPPMESGITPTQMIDAVTKALTGQGGNPVLDRQIASWVVNGKQYRTSLRSF